MLAALLAARLAVLHLTPEAALSQETEGDLAGRAEVLADAGELCPLRLGLADPVVLGPKRVLLHGVLSAGAIGPYRSVALLTEDAGRTWRETMSPTPGSEVSEVVVRGNELWALVAFGVEGPGPVQVFHSADGARTWSHLTEVVKRDPLGVVGGLAFADALHGQLVVDYDGMSLVPPTDLQKTEDGGRTWHVVGPAPAAAPSQAPLAAPPQAWRLRADPGGVLIVEQHTAGPPDTWTPVSRLPSSFRRTAQGALKPCR